MNNPEPILDVAHGDAAVSKQLRTALRAIASNSSDISLQRQIADVLAGRQSVREFSQSEEFNRVLDNVMPTAIQKFAELSDAEREQLAEQERLELERLRNEDEPPPEIDTRNRANTPPESNDQRGSSHKAVIDGTRKPNRDRIVSPDEPDEDDLYFQDRNRRGWLT